MPVPKAGQLIVALWLLIVGAALAKSVHTAEPSLGDFFFSPALFIEEQLPEPKVATGKNYLPNYDFVQDMTDYAYCHNDPINKVDAYGLAVVAIGGDIIGTRVRAPSGFDTDHHIGIMVDFLASQRDQQVAREAAREGRRKGAFALNPALSLLGRGLQGAGREIGRVPDPVTKIVGGAVSGIGDFVDPFTFGENMKADVRFWLDIYDGDSDAAFRAYLNSTLNPAYMPINALAEMRAGVHLRPGNFGESLALQDYLAKAFVEVPLGAADLGTVGLGGGIGLTRLGGAAIRSMQGVSLRGVGGAFDNLLDSSIGQNIPISSHVIDPLDGPGGGQKIINPARLRLPPTRIEGADLVKLQRQIKLHGSSIDSMPPLELTLGAQGQLMIGDGVTRATRALITNPGELAPATIIQFSPEMSLSHLPFVHR